VADGEGVTLGLCVESASPHESTLIEATLDDVNVPRNDRRRSQRKVSRLIYDRAADSDPLRKRLAKRVVELIYPHRANLTKPKPQDGRKTQMLPTPLENRTHLRLAAKLPPTCHPLRT
jgi:hypothetical protein